jgi:O-succinylbenzoic acid--CoA ligase
MVTKVKDEKFGEVGVLLISRTTDSHGISHSTFHIPHSTLPPYWSPRHTLFVDCLPMTGTGKPARKEAEELARKLLEQQDNTPF